MRRGIEVADPALQLHRSAEGLLHGHLLVEREADEEGQRIGGEQPVGLVVAGEVELVGTAAVTVMPGMVRRALRRGRAAAPDPSDRPDQLA